MNYRIEEKTVLSSDGVHRLYVKRYIPEGEPRAVFQVVHGMAEHIGRYDAFMAQMAEQGYVCVGHDHLGHGKTALDREEYGFIAHRDGWLRLVDDTERVWLDVKESYPKLNRVLFGHSMGSFVVRAAASRYPDSVQTLIACGTGGHQTGVGFGIFLADLTRLFRGERHRSNLIQNLAFGSYAKHFGGDPDAWLASDEKVSHAYRDDPACGFRFSVSAMGDLFRVNRHVNRPGWYRALPKTLPVLLIAGTDDPVGNYGAGVKEVEARLKNEEISVTCKLYEGDRHEILNERDRENVVRDVIEWTERNLPL